MAKIRMKAPSPDMGSVTVEGSIQYEVKNGVVEIESAHVKHLAPMGFKTMTEEDDKVLAEAEWLAKNGHAAYEQYLTQMRGRLGDKFVAPTAPPASPELVNVPKGGIGKQGQLSARP